MLQLECRATFHGELLRGVVIGFDTSNCNFEHPLVSYLNSQGRLLLRTQVYGVVMRVRTSSGSGRRASVSVPPPYSASSSAVSDPAVTTVESTTISDVGANPVTGTGVVEISHENAMASGESLIVP